MPICTSCTQPVRYLYTVYQSAYNFRLEQCTACHAFADPYVEHDTLTLLLDLILLKRDVYRHLLFNRGLGARKAGDKPVAEPEASSPPAEEEYNSRDRWWLIARLGFALVCLDASIRWMHLSQPLRSTSEIASWNRHAIEGFLRILVGCFVETAAFHGGVLLSCYLALKALPAPRPGTTVSGIRQQFRYSHVPLSLFYSSLTKLFLLFCLSIWRPNASTTPRPSNSTTFTHPVVVNALGLLDEDTLDREWVVRNVLGGMAAGFGLRVVLDDCHPLFTTGIVLAGWAVKTALASVVSAWVSVGLGGDEKTAAEMWLAYSIP